VSHAAVLERRVFVGSVCSFVSVCVCVCVREREREREIISEQSSMQFSGRITVAIKNGRVNTHDI